MSWVVPPTFTVGQVLTAAQQNILSGDLTALESSYATSLPGSPSDKDRAILVDSTTDPTYQWTFRYNASSLNTDKWEFVGGSPRMLSVDTSEAINSATYVDLATVGPTFTMPRAGQYVLSYGAALDVNTAISNSIYVSPKIGAAATSDTDAALIENNTTAMRVAVARTRQFTVAASDVVKLQYRQGTAGADTIKNRWMTVLPIRVS